MGDEQYSDRPPVAHVVLSPGQAQNPRSSFSKSVNHQPSGAQETAEVLGASRQHLSSGPVDISTVAKIATLPLTAVVGPPAMPEALTDQFNRITKTNAPSVEDALSFLQATLKDLVTRGGLVGAAVTKMISDINLSEFVEKGMELGLPKIIKLFQSISEKVESNSVLKYSLEVCGLRSIISGVAQIDPKGGLSNAGAALGICMGCLDMWQTIGMVAAVAAICVGTGGLGALALCATGIGTKYFGKVLVKETLEQGAKEALERCIKESVEKLATTEVKDSAIKKILGEGVQLSGRSLREVGDAIARKNADLVDDLVKKAGGYDSLTDTAKRKIREKFAKELKKDYEKLFKAVDLDKIAEDGATNWLNTKGGRAVLGNISKGSKKEKELVSLITKEYLDQMDSLKQGWFKSFSEQLAKKGGKSGAKFAEELKGDFLKAVDDAAEPLLKQGIQRAVRKAMKKRDGDDSSVEVRPAKKAEIGVETDLSQRDQLFFRTREWEKGPEERKKWEIASNRGVSSKDWVRDAIEEERKKGPAQVG